jgi:hypothetical protein
MMTKLMKRRGESTQYGIKKMMSNINPKGKPMANRVRLLVKSLGPPCRQHSIMKLVTMAVLNKYPIKKLLFSM